MVVVQPWHALFNRAMYICTLQIVQRHGVSAALAVQYCNNLECNSTATHACYIGVHVYITNLYKSDCNTTKCECEDDAEKSTPSCRGIETNSIIHSIASFDAVNNAQNHT